MEQQEQELQVKEIFVPVPLNEAIVANHLSKLSDQAVRRLPLTVRNNGYVVERKRPDDWNITLLQLKR